MVHAAPSGRHTRQNFNLLRKLRPSRTQLRPLASLIVLKLKPRTHRTSQQRPSPTLHELGSLPHPTFHHRLRPLSPQQIVPNHNRRSSSTLPQLKHLHRIACIKMKHLIRLQPMHLAERLRLPPAYRPSPNASAATNSAASYVRTYHPPSRGCGFNPSNFFTSSAVIDLLSRYPVNTPLILVTNRVAKPKEPYLTPTRTRPQQGPAQRLAQRLAHYFDFAAHATDWRTEILAGLTTFIT